MTGSLPTIRGFWADRAKLDTPSAARFYDAHTPYDKMLISRLARPGARLLDLGCGTCVIANWLVAERHARVHAIDSELEFLAHAIGDPALTTEQALVDDYEPHERYDGVMLLGVINYLVDVPRREALYQRLAASLPADGFILIKSQFGIEGPVEVNAFSEALGAPYYSLYPGLEEETERLSTLFDVEVVDLYPAVFSPHANTKFRHLVGRPRVWTEGRRRWASANTSL